MAKISPGSSIPSQVTDSPWVYAKTPDVYDFLKSNREDEEEGNIPKKKRFSCGKWMIYNDRIRAFPKTGMTNHDFAWQCIKTLVESNPTSAIGVLSAKASTAWGDKHGSKPQSSHGLICCYTSDYSDKVLAKQAADAIRKAYLYPKDLLYKSDSDTSAGKYCHFGSSFVSIYKHTIKNELYERLPEEPLVWNIVCADSE